MPGTLSHEVIDELHCLVWDKPRLNRGEYDPGWSCRDHAVAMAAIICLDGQTVSLRHGRCYFIQGGSEIGPPVAIGQESSSSSGHTWNWVNGFGDFDVSPRLNERAGPWRPIYAPFGIIGSTWAVCDMPTDTVVCQSRREYENAIATATHFHDAGRAVYWVEREEPFRPELLVNAIVHVDSPRTRRIIELAGENAYVKLVAHLRGICAGDRRSLATVSFARAWTRIGEISESEAYKLVQALELRILDST